MTRFSFKENIKRMPLSRQGPKGVLNHCFYKRGFTDANLVQGMCAFFWDQF